MASIKNLKKEINTLCYEVVSDCFTYSLVNQEKNKEAVLKIITETIELRNDLLGRLHSRKKKGENKKTDFNAIRNELAKGMDAYLKKLSALSKT